MRQESKVFSAFKTLAVGIIIAGLIMLEIGMYYIFIKAGIPYQDPTTEMQIQYSINMGVGDVLCIHGAIALLSGIVFRIILAVISKRRNNWGEFNRV